jgi:hypothetical protein
VHALDRAAAAGAIPRRLPIWLTEFGIQSVPDPFVGVSLMRQNEYRAISEKIAVRNPRVVAFSQYLLQDDPPIPHVPKILAYGGFQSGLETDTGRVKPALSGFRLPLVAGAARRGVSLWGLVRPATGATQVQVQYSDGNGWHDAGTAATDAFGYWTKLGPAHPGRRWRVLWTAPDGTLFSSPAVRSYSGV